MNEQKKYGIAVIISSFLLTLLALAVSEGWEGGLGFFENLWFSVEISLFKYQTYSSKAALGMGAMVDVNLIEIPIKYVVVALLTMASYGLTTFLEITPAFRPWKKHQHTD